MLPETDINLKDKAKLAQEKLDRKYPGVDYASFCFLDNNQRRIVIDDLSYRAKSPTVDAVETMTLACKGWMEVIDVDVLTSIYGNRLATLLSKVELDRTAFIFPGEGVRPVLDLLPARMMAQIESSAAVIKSPTQRRVDRTTAAVTGIDIANQGEVKNILRNPAVENVVLVDDVVSTAITAKTFAELSRKGQKFSATSLMTLSPVQNRSRDESSPCGIRGYDSIITAVVYQGLSGTPAVNSLSNLIADTEKGMMVRERYVQKYVEDAKSFEQAVKEIREALR